MISIHVPARGTTGVQCMPPPEIYNFNPRSREGNDAFPKIFYFSFFYFNPRSREGNDNILIIGNQTLTISIHVPARGTT